MTRTGGSTYQVSLADFPIVIRVEAKDLTVYQAVSSNALVTKPSDQSQITSFPLTLTPAQATPLTAEVRVPDPAGSYAAPADVNIVIMCGFAAPNGPDPRYEVLLIPNSGAPLRRDVRPAMPQLSIAFEFR